MNVSQLYEYFNSLYPETLRCEWDNDGLMCCSEAEREIKRVLITLDITDDAVDYGVKNEFDAIISHHPMIFKPLRSVTSSKIISLITCGIAAMSFHTRLDKANGGVNDCLADILGLTDCRPFGEDGLGRIGVLSSPIAPKELASAVADKLGAPGVCMIDGGNICRTVAVVGGAGKDYVSDAIAEGADAYITGEVSYNTYTDVLGEGLTIITAGHYYTEQPVCFELEKKIKLLDESIYTEIFDSNPVIEIAK